jgi:voltage-gated potassium channel
MVVVHQTSAVLVLVTLTLILQSAGMAALIQWVKAHLSRGIHGFGTLRSAVLVIRLTSLIVCLHMLTILPWACFYRWNCFATWESAIYFSAASYSTVGASDLVLPLAWRTLCPIESIVGVLMCGLSASFLFAIVTALIKRDTEAEREEVHADSTSSLTLAEEPGQQNGLGPIEKTESSVGYQIAVKACLAATVCCLIYSLVA